MGGGIQNRLQLRLLNNGVRQNRNSIVYIKMYSRFSGVQPRGSPEPAAGPGVTVGPTFTILVLCHTVAAFRRKDQLFPGRTASYAPEIEK